MIDRTSVRRRAHRYGLRAEFAAMTLLTLKGYRVLARRYRTPAGEIDLVVKRGATIAFVEVKARASLTQARLALNPAGERRIEAAADIWAGRHLDTIGTHVLRFDMVLVAPLRLPVHVQNVFSGRRW